MRVFRALLCAWPPIPRWMRRRRLAERLAVVPFVRVHSVRLWTAKITGALVQRSQGRMGERTAGIRANSVRSTGSAVVDTMRHNRLRQFVPERNLRHDEAFVIIIALLKEPRATASFVQNALALAPAYSVDDLAAVLLETLDDIRSPTEAHRNRYRR